MGGAAMRTCVSALQGEQEQSTRRCCGAQTQRFLTLHHFVGHAWRLCASHTGARRNNAASAVGAGTSAYGHSQRAACADKHTGCAGERCASEFLTCFRNAGRHRTDPAGGLGGKRRSGCDQDPIDHQRWDAAVDRVEPRGEFSAGRSAPFGRADAAPGVDVAALRGWRCRRPGAARLASAWSGRRRRPVCAGMVCQRARSSTASPVPRVRPVATRSRCWMPQANSLSC